MSYRELRDYQHEALRALRDTVRAGIKRIVLQAPTGAGKTRLAGAIAESVLRKNGKLAFCVPRISLVDQTVQSFYADGIEDIGVIQSAHRMTDWSRPIQVCSIDTVRSKKQFPEAKVVIFDECHIWKTAMREWMDAEPQTVFLGFSATPWTRGLGKWFQTLLVVATTKELIAAGYLSPYTIFASSHPDLSAVKLTRGDYQEKDLSDAMISERQGGLTADIVRTWQERWGKPNTLCFAVDCAHAKTLQARFQEAGINAGYQDASTPMAERHAIRQKFHSGEIPVVVSVETLIIGVDWDVRCISFCRPTRSEMLFCQLVGRGLRTAPGKDRLILLDHTGTTENLGFPDDIHHDTLLGGKIVAKDRKPPLPKPCPQCDCLIPFKNRTCQNCGFVLPKPISSRVEQDGELVELQRGRMFDAPKIRRASWEEKCRWYSMLRGYAAEHGKTEKWVLANFRARFGVWPRGMMTEISEPDSLVRSWIKSRQIAWAMRMRGNAS